MRLRFDESDQGQHAGICEGGEDDENQYQSRQGCQSLPPRLFPKRRMALILDRVDRESRCDVGYFRSLINLIDCNKLERDDTEIRLFPARASALAEARRLFGELAVSLGRHACLAAARAVTKVYA